MKVFKLSHALISGGVSFQKFGARIIKDLAASAVVVTGIFKFPIFALLVLDSIRLEWMCQGFRDLLVFHTYLEYRMIED